jgi:hypothetical protein
MRVGSASDDKLGAQSRPWASVTVVSGSGIADCKGREGSTKARAGKEGLHQDVLSPIISTNRLVEIMEMRLL